MSYYAGIGSRKTPDDVLIMMAKIAEIMAIEGFILRSGGAEGADTAFAVGCSLGKGKGEIFRPEHVPDVCWSYATVRQFHPAPDRLSPYVTKLMARNAYQILGRDGNTPVERVICWTPNGKGEGGTGQAIRIAQHYNIPVHDLGDTEVKRHLQLQLQARQ
jgi:hypothetical protein